MANSRALEGFFAMYKIKLNQEVTPEIPAENKTAVIQFSNDLTLPQVFLIPFSSFTLRVHYVLVIRKVKPALYLTIIYYLAAFCYVPIHQLRS